MRSGKKNFSDRSKEEGKAEGRASEIYIIQKPNWAGSELLRTQQGFLVLG